MRVRADLMQAAGCCEGTVGCPVSELRGVYREGRSGEQVLGKEAVS